MRGVYRAASGWAPGGARVIALRPSEGVEELSATRFRALSRQSWLRIVIPGGVPAGRWIRLRYRAGLLGDPVRPVLRIERGPEGPTDHALLPGPVCGAATWTGPLPPDCTGLLLNPVASPGPFSFALDSLEVMSRPRLVVEAVLRRPGLALTTVGQRLRGRRMRARHLLASILASTPFGRYGEWLGEREGRSPLDDAAGADDLQGAGRLGLLITAEPDGTAALSRTLASLEGQSLQGPSLGLWRAWVVAPPSLEAASLELIAAVAARTSAVSGLPVAPDETPDLAQHLDRVAVIRAGDVLAPTALAALAAAIVRHPEADLLYCDEDSITAAGNRSAPCLKPGWSPRLQAAMPHLEGLAMAWAEVLPGLVTMSTSELGPELIRAALSRPNAVVRHVRRVLLHRALPDGPALLSRPRPAPAATMPLADRPLVSAIVPTRDRLHLLRPCVEGLLNATAYPALHVVIVDNGSELAETRAFYGTLASDSRVTILDRPGPFNFSALCNAGVATARGDLVVLLNNDVEVTGPDWLNLLVAEAAPADVGAVGPKLLYPNGRVQHAGVVIGLGGAAGHLYRNRPNEGPGWMGRLSAAHEVSAVTGACLLVRRDRYEAVGGLDEADFPISFNDIDLCLRLREKGWRNLLVPDAVLTHHESASRGRDDRGAKQARAEREARRFSEKWLHVMRDDPYFHPGLSLLRLDPHLG